MTFEDFLGWPPTNQDVSPYEFQELIEHLYARAGGMPDSLVGYQGELLVTSTYGATPVSLFTTSAPISLGQRRIWQARGNRVSIGSSRPLTENEHLGAILRCSSPSEIVLTVAPSPDPALGVADGFRCEVKRKGSGAVRIVATSPYTLVNPDSHAKIFANGRALLEVDGNDVELHGYTTA